MKLCNGCAHLMGGRYCHALAQPAVEEVDPSTNRRTLVIRGHDGSIFAPTSARMREPGQPCGPERALWKPGILFRLFPWAFETEA